MRTTRRLPRRGAPRPTRRLTLAALTALAMGAAIAPAPHAGAGHDPAFPTSAATYRIPYADGTGITVTRDHHNHGGPPGNNAGNNRVDMVGDNPPVNIVAAASGTVMAIVDIHGDGQNAGDGLGNGVDINGNAGQLLLDGVTPHTDAAEHSCQDTEDANGNGVLDGGEDVNGNGTLETTVPNMLVIGTCQQYNNYVWLRHPNGEWSKYSHLATGSVTGAPGNLSVGDTVTVGQVLGIESDIGRAGGRHLHHEIAWPNNLTDDTPFNNGSFVPGVIPGGGQAPPPGSPPGTPNGYYAGGFIQGVNRAPIVCDIPGNLYADNSTSPGNNTFTANPCTNTAPVADAGGPYSVDEGSTVQLDGTASFDPENSFLTYSWSPGANLDDTTSATPTYTAIDDTVDVYDLTVSDIGGDVTAATALTDTDSATVTVNNVAPEVTAVGDSINEGGTATVSATFTDPGTLDTHTATIDWDDGTPPEPVTVAQLEAGVTHAYGDNGVFGVTVTVTDDDGGVGVDVAVVTVANLDPGVVIDLSDQISFPGGDFFVVGAGDELPLAADGVDAGSDDLTFTWHTGDVNTYFNDPVLVPDPFPSPLGTYPFAASDAVGAVEATPGVQLVTLTLTDDDGGSDAADADAIVVGTASTTEGAGWWKHQYSGSGSTQLDSATAGAYLDIVDAVSSVFAESVSATSAGEAHVVLSPTGDDPRARATAALLVAWLQFASGAVAHDATVPLQGDATIGFLDLMFGAEATILNPASSHQVLLGTEQALNRVRHAT